MISEDHKLLREIVASGGRKYTAGLIDRTRYQRLVDFGWLNAYSTNMSDVQYEATPAGVEAAK